MEHYITIKAGEWELAAAVHYPEILNSEERPSRFPIIIICHGFMSNRIGTDRLFVKAARQFSQQGYMVIRFDYAGCGESSGEYGSTGFDSFIDQTRHVLDYALDIDCLDFERIILLGHSLGGAVAIATAAVDKRVKKMVLWAPVAHPFSDMIRITGKQVYDQSIVDGTAEYQGHTFTPMFFDSLSQHQPMREVKHFSGDVLLVHGTDDDIIPVDYSFLYQKLFWTRPEGQCDKEIIFQGDHTFSSRDSNTTLLRMTTEWLDELHKKRNEWNDWMI